MSQNTTFPFEKPRPSEKQTDPIGTHNPAQKKEHRPTNPPWKNKQNAPKQRESCNSNRSKKPRESQITSNLEIGVPATLLRSGVSISSPYPSPQRVLQVHSSSSPSLLSLSSCLVTCLACPRSCAAVLYQISRGSMGGNSIFFAPLLGPLAFTLFFDLDLIPIQSNISIPLRPDRSIIIIAIYLSPLRHRSSTFGKN